MRQSGERSWRVGIGHDRHRLGPGRPLILGGVTIPHEVGLIGHSDADVLLHAVTDAILGAVALGDIGEWFPDTDPANKGRDSVTMLRAVLDMAVELGVRASASAAPMAWIRVASPMLPGPVAFTPARMRQSSPP